MRNNDALCARTKSANRSSSLLPHLVSSWRATGGHSYNLNAPGCAQVQSSILHPTPFPHSGCTRQPVIRGRLGRPSRASDPARPAHRHDRSDRGMSVHASRHDRRRRFDEARDLATRPDAHALLVAPLLRMRTSQTTATSASSATTTINHVDFCLSRPERVTPSSIAARGARSPVATAAPGHRQIRASRRGGEGNSRRPRSAGMLPWLQGAGAYAEELSVAGRARGSGVGPSSGGGPGDEDQAAAVDPAHGDRFGGSVRDPRRPAHR